MLGLLMLVTVVQPGTAAPDPFPARMAALYEEVCLRTFPDDAALALAMAARNARPLTDAEVAVTLRNDPGRGWAVRDGGRIALVFLESPPFHACSVRFPLGTGDPDTASYRAVVEPYMQAHPGFASQAALDRDMGDIHVHAVGDARRLPDGSGEALMLIDQTVIDPARRARGETGVMRRFVHQVAPPR